MRDRDENGRNYDLGPLEKIVDQAKPSETISEPSAIFEEQNKHTQVHAI